MVIDNYQDFTVNLQNCKTIGDLILLAHNAQMAGDSSLEICI